MNLDVTLTQISCTAGSVRAAYLDSEEIVPAGFAIVANRDFEIDWISSHGPGAAERHFVWSGFYESENPG